MDFLRRIGVEVGGWVGASEDGIGVGESELGFDVGLEMRVGRVDDAEDEDETEGGGVTGREREVDGVSVSDNGSRCRAGLSITDLNATMSVDGIMTCSETASLLIKRPEGIQHRKVVTA